jgi:hypothetical protein
MTSALPAASSVVIAGSGKIITNGLAVIINIFSEMIVKIFLGITDQIELLLIITVLLDILFIHFTKFITRRILLDGVIEEIESVTIKFLRRVHQALIFIVANILAIMIKDSVEIQALKWYEIMTLSILGLLLIFTVIQKYVK